MQKRGQLSVFIIIGLVALIATGIAVYVAQPSPNEKLRSDDPLIVASGIVEDCVIQEGIPLLQLMSTRGGTLKQGKLWKGDNYLMLCSDKPGNGCVHSVQTKKQIADEFSIALAARLNSCIRWNLVEKQGWIVQAQLPVAKTIIGYDKADVEVIVGLELTRSGERKNKQSFVVQVPTPIGTLHSLAHEIINKQVMHGYFDKDSWMAEHGLSIMISADRPYPDTMYTLVTQDINSRPYVFHFGMMGIDTIKKPTGPRPADELLPTCKADVDCYANALETDCTTAGGHTIEYDEGSCAPPISRDNRCPDGKCDDCVTDQGTFNHGQQWCDSTVNRREGFDAVGSRHVAMSCIDGQVIAEPCRDYREELCAQENGITACRDNRWQDCWQQTSEGSCQDTTKRDCYWSEGLVPSPSITFLAPLRNNNRCSPVVGPGLMWWTAEAGRVCMLGNEQVWEDIGVFSKAISWKPPVIHSTGMATWCYSLGDCGNKVNIPGYPSRKRYKSTTGKVSDALGQINVDKWYTLPLEIEPFKGTTQSTFRYPEGEKSYMKAQSQEYIDWLISLIPKALAVLTDQIPLHIVHSTYCKAWKTTDVKSKMPAKCELCEDSLSGCSLYLCKSLGQECQFYLDNQAYPRCKYVGASKVELDVDVTFPDNRAVEDGNGYMVTDLLVPFETVKMIIHTPEPSTCTISAVPGLKNFAPETEDPELEGVVTLIELIGEGISGDNSDNFIADLRDPATEQVMDIRVPDIAWMQAFKEKGSTLSLLANPTQLSAIMDTEYFKEFMDSPAANDERIQSAKDGVEEFIGKAEKAYREDPNFNSLSNKVELLLWYNDLKKDPPVMTMYLNCEGESSASSKTIPIKAAIKKDDKPPVVLNITPSEGKWPTEAKLLLNEPSTCKFAIDNDASYESMDPMTCDEDAYGARECELLLPDLAGAHSLFVKCRDRPYALVQGSVKKGTRNYAEGATLSVLGTTARVSISPFLTKNSIEIASATKLEIDFNTAHRCRYDAQNVSYDMMGSSMNCEGIKCEAPLAGTIYYACLVEYGPYQNTNKESFRYDYS